MICLWCWQSLQMLCGNRQGLILASEFFCGIPDIFSILGEGVSLEVEMWSLYLARPPQVEFCLRSCISSPGPHRFCTLAFVTLQGFLNVSCGCVWSLCSLPACVSIFRLCAAIAGQHFKGFFFFSVMWCLHSTCFESIEGRRGVWGKGWDGTLTLKKKVHCMKLHVILLLKKRKTFGIKTEQSIWNNYRWGNGAKAVPRSAEWSTVVCIGCVSWGRSHFKSTALKLVAGVLFWRPLK